MESTVRVPNGVGGTEIASHHDVYEQILLPGYTPLLVLQYEAVVLYMTVLPLSEKKTHRELYLGLTLAFYRNVMLFL
jgi:hypothetical protein